jgi:hypothetical protein
MTTINEGIDSLGMKERADLKERVYLHTQKLILFIKQSRDARDFPMLSFCLLHRQRIVK